MFIERYKKSALYFELNTRPKYFTISKYLSMQSMTCDKHVRASYFLNAVVAQLPQRLFFHGGTTHGSRCRSRDWVRGCYGAVHTFGTSVPTAKAYKGRLFVLLTKLLVDKLVYLGSRRRGYPMQHSRLCMYCKGAIPFKDSIQYSRRELPSQQ